MDHNRLTRECVILKCLLVLQFSQKGQQQRNSCFILQQIIDLKRLQLNGGSNPSPLIHSEEQNNLSSSMRHHAKKFNENLDQPSQNSRDLGTDVQQRDNSPLQELKCDDPFPFPFLPSSSSVGEQLWQCRSPVQNSQVRSISTLFTKLNYFVLLKHNSITN